MPSYKVILKDGTEIQISADDVEVSVPTTEDSEGNEQTHSDTACFNFIKGDDEDGQITVAAIPFSHVHYITS